MRFIHSFIHSFILSCFNMHGVYNEVTMFNSLCNIADIISLKEHWLASFNMDKLISFHHEFVGYGWSAMEDKIQSGILTGRPFCGLGLLVRKSLNANVSVVDIMYNVDVLQLNVHLNLTTHFCLS